MVSRSDWPVHVTAHRPARTGSKYFSGGFGSVVLLVMIVNANALTEREELLDVTRMLERHGIVLVVDDPYSEFTYEDSPPVFNPAGAADRARSNGW